MDLERWAGAAAIGSPYGLIFEFSGGIDCRSRGRPSSFATAMILSSSKSSPFEFFSSGFFNAPSAGTSRATVTSTSVQPPSLSRIQLPRVVEQYVVRAIAVLSL